MYAIYAYIGVVLGVNVGIYGIHGVSGYSDLVLRDAAYGWVARAELARGPSRPAPSRIFSPTRRAVVLLWMGRLDEVLTKRGAGGVVGANEKR